MNEGLRALQDALRTPGLETAAWNGPPPSFHDAMRRWWEAYDRYLAHVSGSLDVSCRKGCTWCCEDNPRGVSGVELMGVLRATDVSAREAAQHFEGLHQQHGDASWTVLKRARRPCPFLKDGACSVYAVRPMPCRSFFSITAPEACSPDSEQEPTNPKLEPPQVIKELLKAISQRLMLHQLPMDLHRGMAAIEELAATRPGLRR